MTSTACSGRAGYSDWTTSSGVCTRKEMTDLYVLEKVGFRKLRWKWNTGKKLDKGPNGDEWYISALLERPLV